MQDPTDKNGIFHAKQDHYMDMVGKAVTRYLGIPDLYFIEGEVMIFLGYKDKKGGRMVIHIFGTNANKQFKEKIYEDAIGILVEDPGTKIDKKI